MNGQRVQPSIIPGQSIRRRGGSPPPALRIEAPVDDFVARYARGETIDGIATATGFTYKVVRSRLIERGIERRKPRRKSKYPGRPGLIRLYEGERLPTRAIGKLLGVSGRCVAQWLHEDEIAVRSIAEAKAGQKPSPGTIEASVRARRKRALPGRPVVGYKVNSDGYVLLWNKELKKYEREHRKVMEKKLGRELAQEEISHHENRVRDDNDPGNLGLFGSMSDHMREHSKTRGRLPNGSFAPEGQGIAKVGSAKCSVAVCNRPARRRGLCSSHWFWSRNHGWTQPLHAIGEGLKFPRPGRRKKTSRPVP